MGGGNPGCLTVKNTCKRTLHISSTLLPIPMMILQRYRYVALAVDVMYANSIRFINTISRHIKFMMAEDISNTESSTLQKSINQVKRVYV